MTAAVPLRSIERPVDTADAGAPGPFTLEIVFTFKGGAVDLAHPPALFGVRLLHIPAGKTYTGPSVRADLAIVPDKCWMVPGKERGSKIKLHPQVAVLNRGPHDIPAQLLKQLQLSTRYDTGKWGKKPEDAQATHTLTNSFPTDRPWRKGEVRFITPTHPHDLPGGVLLTWQKLFLAKTSIIVPASQELVDPDLANNTYEIKHEPPLVLGEGPGPYEVLVFDYAEYQGDFTSWEFKPGLRHRLIWELGDEWDDRISSAKIGSKVGVRTWNDHHFYDESEKYVRTGFYEDGPCAIHWVGPEADNKISSLILFPTPGASLWKGPPVGITLKNWDRVWGPVMEQFFPLPEDPNQKRAKFATITSPIHDLSDLVQVTYGVWGYLYEDKNFGGHSGFFPVRRNGRIKHTSTLSTFDLEDKVSSLYVGEMSE